MARRKRQAVPLTEVWDWQLRAACRGEDARLFFFEERERGQARADRAARAKEVCARCRVTPDCLAQALRLREEYGIWGGLTENERLALSARAGDG
jgi:WhiB family redox-sensing transcriptional regulator